MGSIVYRQPDSGRYRQSDNNRHSGDQGPGATILVWAIIAGLALYIGYFLLAAAYSAIFILTAGSLSALFKAVTHADGAVALDYLAAEGVCGAVIGTLVGTLRRFFGIRRRLGESFISALISRRLFALDSMFIPSVLISAGIGFVIGGIGGAGGTISLPQFLSGAFHTVINADLYVLAGMAASGGAGGFGSDGGVVLFLLLLLVILIQAVVIGILLGIIAYVAAGMIAGLAKGAGKGAFRSLVEDGWTAGSAGLARVMFGNAVQGARDGMVTGALVGLMQGIITPWVMTDSFTPVAPPEALAPAPAAAVDRPLSHVPQPVYIPPPVINVPKIDLPLVRVPDVNTPPSHAPPVFTPPVVIDMPAIAPLPEAGLPPPGTSVGF
jgi:hypothetical protein